MDTEARAIFLLITIILCLASQLSAQTITPNDPMFGQQWNLQRIGARNGWATTTGSSNVVVAVIDRGINYLHQDLAANMWRNPGETGFGTNGVDKATNGIDDDGNGYADDVHGIDTGNRDSDPMEVGSPFHGTACASIIGAVGNNTRGIAGLNWQVSLMAIRGYTEDGTTDYLTSHLEAINYVLMMKNRGVNIRVVSHSGNYGSWDSQAFREARERLEAAGVLWVCSAANQGVDLDQWPFYPMSWRLRNTIAVGGSDTGDNLWSSSNYGQNTVDLAAPSVSIPVAWGPATNAYTTFGGTSASCPHVAGAAALLLAANPALSPEDVKAALFGSVDQPVGFRGKMSTHGRLNVARALEYLTNTNPAAIVVTALPRGQKTPANAPLEVIFNRPMNPATVESAFVITPPISGTFEWAPDNRSFVYRHDTPFDVTTNYNLRLLGSAQDASGGTLDGDYDRIREGSPTDDFTWTFNFALPNDDFPGAQVLAGASGFVQGNNQRASVEDEEFELLEQFPEAWQIFIFGRSLWYRWTPPEAGWYAFDLTSGTVFDSLLTILTGNQLEQAVVVADNDNYGTSTRSRVSFAALSNTNYYLWVATKYDYDPTQVGNFKLAWYPTPTPSFTSTHFSPASGAPGTVVTLFGTNFTGATRVFFNGATATFTNWLTNNVDLRITAVVPPDAISGPITVVTPHGNVTSTLSFQVPPPKLALSLGGPNLLIRWPGTSTAWVLEETADLAHSPWTPVAQTPITTNGETRMLLEAPPTGNGFYRLKRN